MYPALDCLKCENNGGDYNLLIANLRPKDGCLQRLHLLDVGLHRASQHKQQEGNGHAMFNRLLSTLC